MSNKYKEMIDWATSEDTGSSSTSLLRFMCGLPPTSWGIYFAPSDADDRGRCIRLLNRFPEFWDRLEELGKKDYLWSEQIPLIKKEAGK